MACRDQGENGMASGDRTQLERVGQMDPADFDPEYYLMANPDVAAAGVDPYQHYLQYGWREGRNPSAKFDTVYYLLHNPDVAAAAGLDPLAYYLQFGHTEARATLPPVGPGSQISPSDF